MLREVIEETNFADEFDSFRIAYAQMDAVHADLTWTLGSNPRIGTLVEGYVHPTIRMFITTPIGDAPAFRVLYRFTDVQVILLAFDIAEA